MRIMIIATLVILSLFSFGQDRKPDIVRKANGDSLVVYVINISEYDVTYSFPNEQPTYTVTKNIIKEIQFGSGRIEKISEPVIVKGESDWEKVKVTTVSTDIKGLNLKKDLTAKVNAGGFFPDVEKKYNEAIEKLKRQAAAIGAHIVLFETKTITNNAIIVTGKAYSY